MLSKRNLEFMLSSFSWYTLHTTHFATDESCTHAADNLIAAGSQANAQRLFVQLIREQGDEYAFMVLNEATRHIHETRHFLDLACSSWGTYIAIANVKFFIDLIRALRDLSPGQRVELPLDSWRLCLDCPRALREAVGQITSSSGFQQWLFGDYLVDKQWPEGDIMAPFITPVEVNGTEYTTLVTKVNESQAYVVGASCLAEASAIACQFVFLFNLVGREITSWWYTRLMERYENSKAYRYYTIPALTRSVVQRYAPVLDYAFAEYSLAGEMVTKEDLYKLHPGARYVVAYDRLAAVEGAPALVERFDDDSEARMSFVQDILPMPEYLGTLRSELDRGAKTLSDLEDLLDGMELPEFEGEIILAPAGGAAYGAALRFERRLLRDYLVVQRKRVDDLDSMLDPQRFVTETWKDLPMPHASINWEGDHLLRGDEPGMAVRHSEGSQVWLWFLLVNFLQSLITEKDAMCPIKDSGIACSVRDGVCGIEGRHYERDGMICEYGWLLDATHISDKEIVPVMGT